MAAMIHCVDLGDDDYVEIVGGDVTLWQGVGPAAFTGTLVDLDVAYPSVIQRLLDGGYIRSTN